jgi:CBS-domain-containing membrane protein
MARRQLRRLVVVDENGAVMGVVAQADLALHAPAQQTGQVVKEISEPAA